LKHRTQYHSNYLKYASNIEQAFSKDTLLSITHQQSATTKPYKSYKSKQNQSYVQCSLSIYHHEQIFFPERELQPYHPSRSIQNLCPTTLQVLFFVEAGTSNHRNESDYDNEEVFQYDEQYPEESIARTDNSDLEMAPSDDLGISNNPKRTSDVVNKRDDLPVYGMSVKITRTNYSSPPSSIPAASRNIFQVTEAAFLLQK